MRCFLFIIWIDTSFQWCNLRPADLNFSLSSDSIDCNLLDRGCMVMQGIIGMCFVFSLSLQRCNICCSLYLYSFRPLETTCSLPLSCCKFETGTSAPAIFWSYLCAFVLCRRFSFPTRINRRYKYHRQDIFKCRHKRNESPGRAAPR